MGKIVLTGSSGAVGSGVAAYIIQNSAHSLVLIDAKIPSKPLDDPRVTYVTANLSDPTVSTSESVCSVSPTKPRTIPPSNHMLKY